MRTNTHLSPFLPQPTPQCNGPSAAGKQEVEVRDRGEEAEIRAPKVMRESADPVQNRAHPEESVWRLGPENECHHICQDSTLLRYVPIRLLLFTAMLS